MTSATRSFAVVLTTVMLLGTCACGTQSADPTRSDAPRVTTEKPMPHSTSSPSQSAEPDQSSSSSDSTASMESKSESSDSSLVYEYDGDFPASDARARSLRLDLPQSVQETAYWCAPASLQMVLHYRGLDASQATLAQEMNTSSETGTEYEDLARVASLRIFGAVPANDAEAGYRAVILEPHQNNAQAREAFEQRVMHDLSQDYPVFVSINLRTAYGTAQDAVHQVVLYGMDTDESGRAKRFLYRDPSYTQQDPQYEGKKSVSADELWHAMIENPEPAYVW